VVRYLREEILSYVAKPALESVTAYSLYSKAEDGKSVVDLIKCAKCSKEIDAGKEVKKGWISKKTYHAECAK